MTLSLLLAANFGFLFNGGVQLASEQNSDVPILELTKSAVMGILAASAIATIIILTSLFFGLAKLFLARRSVGKSETAEGDICYDEITEPPSMVPLASYWRENPRREETLRLFLGNFDLSRGSLAQSLIDRYGPELTVGMSLGQQVDFAQDVLIWSSHEATRWRLCLDLRQQVLVEGLVPVTSRALEEHAEWLRLLTAKLDPAQPLLPIDIEQAAGTSLYGRN